MTDSKTHIQSGINGGRLSASRLERLLHWMQLAQKATPPPRLSAEQLTDLLAHLSPSDDRAEQTST